MAATTVVAVAPVAAVCWLRAEGVISSPWVCVVLAMALSLAASFVGNAYWKRRRDGGDLLFSELLVWGWLRRVRVERQLANAVELLGLAQSTEHPLDARASVERKVHLLGQLAAALDAEERYAAGHSRRVARHSVMVARRMGLPSEEVARVRTAAAVHDVGKLRVPLDVLNKPGKLTSAEFEITKRHAAEGAKIVRCLGDPELVAIVRHHHERFDGTGYPSGLLGDQVPLGARIIAVADTFDALTSVRPYRLASTHKQAIDVLAEESGSQFDPAAVRAFLEGYNGKRAIGWSALVAALSERALVWLRGTTSVSATASFGGTITNTAAVIAIGAAAAAAPIGVAPASELHKRYQPPLLEAGAAPIPPRIRAPRRLSHRTSSHPIKKPAHRRAHEARSPGSPASVSGSAVSAASTGSFANRHQMSGRGSGGDSSGSPRGASGGKPIGGQHGSSGGGPGGDPGTGSGGGPGSGSGGGSNAGSAGGSAGAAGTASAGVGSGTGSTGVGSGGAPGSGSGGPTSVGSGGSSGSASGGSQTGTSLTKAQCKNDGYAQYGFPNQGQCVAFVEQSSR